MSLVAAVEATSFFDIFVSVLLGKSDSIYIHGVRVSFPDVGSGVGLLFVLVGAIGPRGNSLRLLPLIFKVRGLFIPPFNSIWDSVHPIDVIDKGSF